MVNCPEYKNRPIKYLVIHYTAGVTSKAGTANNVKAMFGNPASRSASADWIVDDGGWVQFNPDPRNRYTYAVGGKMQNTYGGKYFGKCKNYNSISIEMCSCNKTGKVVNEYNVDSWYFTDKVVANTIKLAQQLVKEYNIPKENLIRHFDVNSKVCPNIIGWNTYGGASDYKWQAFKNAVYAESEDDMTEEQTKKLIRQELTDYIKKSTMNMDFVHVDEEISDGTRLNDYATRGEVIEMIHRLKDYLKKEN